MIRLNVYKLLCRNYYNNNKSRQFALMVRLYVSKVLEYLHCLLFMCCIM